jgi:hypothetical protein
VEYTIRRDRDGKLSAVQIRRAAPGSVVFEVVGEELLRGTILERPITGKQVRRSCRSTCRLWLWHCGWQRGGGNLGPEPAWHAAAALPGSGGPHAVMVHCLTHAAFLPYCLLYRTLCTAFPPAVHGHQRGTGVQHRSTRG